MSGNVIHIPVDRDRAVGVLESMIPHTWEDTRTVFIKYKRRMRYKRGFLEDTVNPSKVFAAAKFLETKDLFKKHRIKLDKQWKIKSNDAPEEFAEVLLLNSAFLEFLAYSNN